MNVAAHKILYEDSLAFGTMEILIAEQGKTDLEQKVKDMNHLIIKPCWQI